MGKKVFEIDKVEDQQTQEGAAEVNENIMTKNQKLTQNFTGDQNILLAKYMRKEKLTLDQAIKKVLEPSKKEVVKKAKVKIVKEKLNKEEKHLYLCRLMSKGKHTMHDAVLSVYGKDSDEYKDHLKRSEEFKNSDEGKADAKAIALAKQKAEDEAIAKAKSDIEAAEKVLKKV